MKDSFNYNPDEISLDLDDDAGDNEDSAETASPSRNISRSRLVLPPPKNSDAGDDNGTLSSKAASLSVQEGSGGGGGFKRSSLILPPPRNLDFGDDEESGRGSVGDGHEALFFLDKDGEPNVKRRRDVLPD